MQFTNAGMLNTVSKRLTVNTNPSASPGILNAEGGVNGYYTNDTTLGGANMTDLMKQQRFDEQINNLLFGGSVDQRYMRMLDGDNTLDRQQKALQVISNAPVNQYPVAVRSMAQQLPQQAVLGTVNDTIEKPSIVPQAPPPLAPPPQTPPERIKESQVTEGFVGFCNTHGGGISLIVALFVIFIVYMLVQMYISQKRLEWLIELHTGKKAPSILGGYNAYEDIRYDNIGEEYSRY